MRIAQISPLFEAVPPKLYGGTERVVYSLTEELVAMGHDVTLFASGDSLTSAKLAPMREQALRLDPTVKDWVATYYRMVELIYRRKEEFDVIHFHIDYFPLQLFSRQNVPFLTRSTAASTSVSSSKPTRRSRIARSCRSRTASAGPFRT